MNIKNFIEDWIEASNAFDTDKYLSFFATAAILEDPSVGRVFNGLEEIRNYFESYFVGYNTNTKIVQLTIADKNHAHLEVEFTGTFPEKIIGGMFDFTFKDEKIMNVKADLL
ncbi:nuclear transport factor 2 family protein [Flavobacterium sp. SM2513]|uniref:nuclear transport factor 2 family protein n=1 Tax=Flavobacterium sp. SM2513 TaxID=3424766 RepID=UPI003D7FD6AE